jgi:hypothetical protein
MTIDDRALHELIVESEDLQADALRDQRRVNADLAEIHQLSVSEGIDPDEVRHHAQQYNEHREQVLREGPGVGVLAAAGGMAAIFGAALTQLMAGPAAADDSDVDVMVLQTAASLENLAVATYGAALTLPFIKDGNATVVAFAKKTMGQHKDHGSAFNDNAKSLGGKQQTKTNSKYQKVVNDALPTLKAPGDVVKLAMALEQVATQTYNNNISLMRDETAKSLMASVMGVESQHLATLRAVDALLAGGAADLIKIPTDLAKLPAAAGSVGFSGNFEGTEKASPPEEGAVK